MKRVSQATSAASSANRSSASGSRSIPISGPGRAETFGNEPGVAGAADGAVDGHRSRSRVEKLDQLAGQDGHVRGGHVNQCGQSSP